MDRFLMVDVPAILDEWARLDAQADLRLINVRSLPRIEDDREREQAYEDLRRKAFGDFADDSDEMDRDAIAEAKAMFGGKVIRA